MDNNLCSVIENLIKEIKRGNEINRLQLDFDIIKYHNSIARSPYPVNKTEEKNLNIFIEKYNEFFYEKE